jgi:hypothetical protein
MSCDTIPLFYKYLASQGCIKALCDFLGVGHSDTKILKFCLDGLGNILKVGEAEKFSRVCDVNIYAQMIDDAGAWIRLRVSRTMRTMRYINW